MRELKNAPGSSAGKLRLQINRQSARAASELVQTGREILDDSLSRESTRTQAAIMQTLQVQSSAEVEAEQLVHP